MENKLFCTPIQKLNLELLGNKFYIKRDDLLPISFGGNKVRIANEFFYDMQHKSCDCIIGYGNSRSNLNRIIANMAKMKGYPCHIVSPADDDGKKTKTTNSKLVDVCGSIIHRCLKSEVSQTVGEVIIECKKNNLKPYYINGNKYGKGNEAIPVKAYVSAYKEMLSQANSMGINFDYIFLATGTGMTQAGLVSGKVLYKGNEKIIGISVARNAKSEEEIIKNYATAYFNYSNIKSNDEIDICVVDDYICGGYGKYNGEIKTTIVDTYCNEGISLDPTYVGKAFYGMKEHLKKCNITGKNILFIHTGSSPLFIDFLNDYNNKEIIVEECDDFELLVEFLLKIDSRLPVSLSSRVNIPEYAKKVLFTGKVLCIKKSGSIVAASLFYCNDTDNKKAYLTLIGTDLQHTGKGFARKLLDETEKVAKTSGMKTMHLDTEKTNCSAISLYSSEGYIIENVGQKVHMFKEL